MTKKPDKLIDMRVLQATLKMDIKLVPTDSVTLPLSDYG